MLHILNLHHVICQLYLNFKKEKSLLETKNSVGSKQNEESPSAANMGYISYKRRNYSENNS